MPHDPEAFAEMVVLTIKSALAPLTERLAVAEQANRDLQARVLELSGLRDRLTTVETKATMPVQTALVESGPDPVLAGLLEQVRDRVTALETKAAPVLPPDLTERVSALETRFEIKAAESAPVLASVVGLTKDLGAVRDRVIVVETKCASPVTAQPDLTDRLADVEARLSAAELRAELKASETVPLVASLVDLSKDLGAMRERVAVVEVRGQVAGPAGKDGQDGSDGIGFEDLAVVQEDDRTVVFRGTKGHVVRDFGRFTVPAGIYRGVFMEGQSYDPGDEVTWAGSMWHANEATAAKPGEGSKAWTLQVKRGRDGKDGRDGRDPVPVVRA